MTDYLEILAFCEVSSANFLNFCGMSVQNNIESWENHAFQDNLSTKSYFSHPNSGQTSSDQILNFLDLRFDGQVYVKITISPKVFLDLNAIKSVVFCLFLQGFFFHKCLDQSDFLLNSFEVFIFHTTSPQILYSSNSVKKFAELLAF